MVSQKFFFGRYVSHKIEFTLMDNEEGYDINALDPENEKELYEAFSQYDCDRTGEINRQELKALLISMGKQTTDEDMDLIMSVVDVDGSGTIDFEEFCFVASEKIQGEGSSAENDIHEIFRYFDLDNDGHINFDELFRVVNEMMDLGLGRNAVGDMLRYADTTGSNTISFKEFSEIFQNGLLTPRFMKLENKKHAKAQKIHMYGRYSKKKKRKSPKKRKRKSKSPKKSTLDRKLPSKKKSLNQKLASTSKSGYNNFFVTEQGENLSPTRKELVF